MISHGGTEMHENEICTGAVHLHQDLGPGLREAAHEVTPARRLKNRGLSVERQVAIAILRVSVPP